MGPKQRALSIQPANPFSEDAQRLIMGAALRAMAERRVAFVESPTGSDTESRREVRVMSALICGTLVAFIPHGACCKEPFANCWSTVI